MIVSPVVYSVLRCLKPVINGVPQTSDRIVDQFIAVCNEVISKFLDLQSPHELFC